MAERSNAAVLKTVEGNTSGGSNPSLSAWKPECKLIVFRPFYFYENAKGEIVIIDELVNFPD